VLGFNNIKNFAQKLKHIYGYPGGRELFRAIYKKLPPSPPKKLVAHRDPKIYFRAKVLPD
jgi:hypothetical protein